MGALAIAQLVAVVLGMLPGLIRDVETLFGSGNGKAKREAVLSAAGSAIDVSNIAAGHELVSPAMKDSIISAAGGLTDVIVAGANAVGALKKTPRDEIAVPVSRHAHILRDEASIPVYRSPDARSGK